MIFLLNCWVSSQSVIEQMQGKSLEERLVLSWQELQADVDHLMDSGMNTSSQRLHNKFPGIKQVAFVCMHVHTQTHVYVYITNSLGQSP